MARSNVANIDSLRFDEQGSNPSTPASGFSSIFLKADGLYVIDDAGNVTGPLVSTASSGGIPVTGWIDKTAETWTYAGASDPEFTFTISGDQTSTYQAGQRLKLTQTTVKYFIITKVAYGAPNTTVTIYGGTDYDLANAAISANYMSPVKAPFGFPMDPTKWRVLTTDTSDQSQASPTQDAWYNPGSISIAIPTGAWHVSYQASAYAASTTARVQTTLSTANNSESDADFSCFAGGPTNVFEQVSRRKILVLTSATTYYLNIRTSQSSASAIQFSNSVSKLLLAAECAYL
jgi:hypothetical protein